MKISNVFWSFLGLFFPLVVAAYCIPKLIAGLGQERFGLLVLAWGLIGYAGALDMGVGRATTYFISRLKVGSDNDKFLISDVLATATRVTYFSSFACFIIIIFAVFFGVAKLIKLNEVDVGEVEISILILSLALPLQALSATYRGVNEAYSQFRNISIVRAVLGVANFGVPLFIAHFSEKIYILIGGLVFSRIIAFFAFKYLALKCIGMMSTIKNKSFSCDIAKKLLEYGGWVTVSGLLNPMVNIADKFFVSSIIAASAVSLYFVPSELVVQSLILVGSITTVLFPYLSQLHVHSPLKVKQEFFKILSLSIFLMTCVTIGYQYLGDFIIRSWLGEEADSRMYGVLAVLSYGLVPYTIGTLCTSYLHAKCKTEITAKINCIEFPLFLVLIYTLTSMFDIIGAAYAWVARVTIDAILFFYFVNNDK